MSLASTPERRASFITLEGGEGVGKSTQVLRLVERLRQTGIEAIATREPGGSPGAEMLRDLILSGKVKELGAKAEAILFSAARIDHIDRKIAPTLAAGTWVVSDRFADSTRAYQGALGGLEPAFLRALERVTLGDMRPDLTLLLDLPPEIGLARAAQRRGPGVVSDRFEREGIAFHAALRKAFLEIAAAEPQRCVIVDAAQSEDDVAQAIWDTVAHRLLGAWSREARGA
jgi:dTMP kinase